jgi:hypothetical protein
MTPWVSVQPYRVRDVPLSDERDWMIVVRERPNVRAHQNWLKMLQHLVKL